MGGEEAVERQGGAFAGRGEGEIAVERRIVRIADRRNGGQAVDRAAQDHDNEPRIARARRARRRAEEPGAAQGARAKRARGADQGAAGDRKFRSVADHRHLRWNSGAMNRSASACSRNSARVIAWLVSRDAVSPRTAFMAASGSAGAVHPLAHEPGEIEPGLHAFRRGPGVAQIGKTVGARGPP